MHRSHITISLILIALLLPACAQAQPSLTPTTTPITEIRPELGEYFNGATGAFALHDPAKNTYILYNPERCALRFLPASTFKVLNALIGLETGVIPDENYVIKWDGKDYPIPAWNQDHTLKTAIQNSVVWYFQELARRVGRERMQQYVSAARYGNMDISGNIDSFWLDGGLRISALEQVDFLERLYRGELPFSPRSLQIVRSLIILELTDAYTLSGKTGSVQRVAVHTGWFVGYLESGGKVVFFATNLESSDPNGFANGEAAKGISRKILQGLEMMTR
jgi:beta-lactamase class D